MVSLLPKASPKVRRRLSTGKGDFREFAGISSLRRAAFTLLELSVSVAIVGILIVVMVPTLNHVRSSADRSACMSNLHQVGLIVHDAAADNDGRIPDVSADGSKNGKDALVEFVKANGGTADLLVCPAEKRLHPVPVSSYFWLSFLENSPIGTPAIRGEPVPASQAPLVIENWSDDVLPHARTGALASAGNVLLADGSVKKLPLDGDQFQWEGGVGGSSIGD